MSKNYRFLLWRSIAAASLAIATPPALAATFFIDYSGAAFLNAAEAHGMVTLDDALLANPSAPALLTPGVEITAFSLAVSGASSGNGAFQLSDFDAFSWDTAGAALVPQGEPPSELLGKMTAGGGWGATHDGTAGDFNLIALTVPNAPTAAGFAFTIATNGGAGDSLHLTSIRPVPVPAAFWLFGTGMLAFAVPRRKNTVFRNA
jgi:hypothetical protein